MQPFFKSISLILLIFLASCGTPNAPTTQPPPPTRTTGLSTLTPTAVPTEEPTPTPFLLQPDKLDSIGDPYAPELGNLGYDVQQYDIRLAIEPALETLVAEVTITAAATTQLSQLSLDFIGYDIESVLFEGDETTYFRDNDKLFVDLPDRLAPGDPFDITISYRGSPVLEISRFVTFAPSIGLYFVDKETAYILSEPDGTRYWLPNNDHPRDKAMFRFEITVPDGLTAVANGQLLETISGSAIPLPSGTAGTTFVWQHRDPMASYLATIAVGEYQRFDDVSPNGVPIRHYIFPENQADFNRVGHITGEVIDWMSDLFGPYPFENFGFVTADATGASLETQTMVVLSTRMINADTVVHEIAHMWFGNYVSLDSWSEMWRNEGFATYITVMWNNRDDPEGLELEMAGYQSAVEESGRPLTLGAPPPEALFSFQTYVGGALMVHELRLEMGDEAFFEGLRRYFETYGHSTASDAQFQAVMEAAAGRSLDAFFAKWLQ